jgi:nucleolar protein 4
MEDRKKKISAKDETVNDTSSVQQKPLNLLNDPKKTIFVRNLGFQTDEATLKNFFTKYGKIVYVKIVKNRETNSSKGSAFIMFTKESECNEVLSIYSRYEGRMEETINPFELEGRNLKIFSAMSKDDAQNLEKNVEKINSLDKRRRDLLYYGLNIKDELISAEDGEKREHLIKLKKVNFGKNPNYHVSTTRITVRNFDKSITEDKLKAVIKQAIDKFLQTQDKDSIYHKVKKIKQIKLLKDKNEIDKNNEAKSKCCAFVEVYDETLAKAIIDNLTNLKLSKKNEKRGLILDFALDDIRKTAKMMKRLDALKEKQKIRNAEREATKEPKEAKEVKEPGESIENINDIEKLIEIYKNTIGRGKKQRILKKLKKLGHNKPIETIHTLKNENKNFEKVSQRDIYTSTKIENEKTNLNKKYSLENKKKKAQKGEEKPKQSGKLLNKKRQRDEFSDDDDDDGIDMTHYIAQINKKLKNK